MSPNGEQLDWVDTLSTEPYEGVEGEEKLLGEAHPSEASDEPDNGVKVALL